MDYEEEFDNEEEKQLNSLFFPDEQPSETLPSEPIDDILMEDDDTHSQEPVISSTSQNFSFFDDDDDDEAMMNEALAIAERAEQSLNQVCQ